MIAPLPFRKTMRAASNAVARAARAGRRYTSAAGAAAAAASSSSSPAARASSLISLFGSYQPLQWHGAGCQCAMHRASSSAAPGAAAAGGSTDYAFEMAASSIRFGSGCTAEVGMDVVNLRARRVMVFSDKHIAAIRGGPLTKVLAALHTEQRAGRIADVCVFDEVQVEPTDKSFAVRRPAGATKGAGRGARGREGGQQGRRQAGQQGLCCCS